VSGDAGKGKTNVKVDEKRRELLKTMAVGAGVAALTSVVPVNREKLKKVLKPVKLEDLFGVTADADTPLEARAKAKERELKEWCKKEADKLCREKGENSVECKEARKRCELITVKATPAKKGVRYAMALDLNKCIGCRRCIYACVMENNTGRNLGIEWIRILELSRMEALELLGAEWYYDGEVPEEDKVYVPIACMHCENPPCVQVCPVRATWKEPDGIVVVDYDKCIGCRYCQVACPYGARRFNWTKPVVPVQQLNPNMHILGNVPRQVHVMEKCTWCIQRVRDGGVPACVEACPVGARVFGDLNDPNSPIRRIAKEYGLFVLKPEAGTKPRFFYFFGPQRTPPRAKAGSKSSSGGGS
jgi:Fe-S-cluster-containing dehydrogenase component